ncbi:LytTR family DNA-binding domain-containing protein [Arenicella sp. 4NH20-0111]|uniref:LytR/AlgR family response regulator transcription factor n=1 Tax=Arenicella sp. 4NH20-0111 TaxID=3127648 RepID=UPI003101BE89
MPIKKYTAVIVDDEALARANIRAALSQFPNWEVASELGSGEQLTQVISSLKPDVIFLDIRIPKENGIEIAERLNRENVESLIIFVTAYDDYAVEAFELFALDYLLKPFDDNRMKQTLERAEERLNNPPAALQLSELKQHISGDKSTIDKLIIRSVGSLRIVPLEDIFWLGSSGNYVEVHHRHGMHLHRVNLSYLESKLDPDVFCRTHRSAIVRLSEAREFKALPDDKYCLILTDGTTVKVSKSHKDELLDKLGAA